MNSAAFNLESFKAIYECPISYEPLATCVSLGSCLHKINELAAHQIFGSMVNDRVEKPGWCPLCRKRVETYHVDHKMRELVEAIEKSAIPQLSKEEKKSDGLSYPGKSSKFIVDYRWCRFPCESYIIRQIGFVSQNKDAFFKKVDFLGYSDGCVALCVEFANASKDKAAAYLKAKGYSVKEKNMEIGFWKSENERDTKDFFKILVENNEFPQTQLSFLQKIVASNNWKIHESD